MRTERKPAIPVVHRAAQTLPDNPCSIVRTAWKTVSVVSRTWYFILRSSAQLLDWSGWSRTLWGEGRGPSKALAHSSLGRNGHSDARRFPLSRGYLTL